MYIMEIINFSKYFTENANYLSIELGLPVSYQLEPNKEYIVFSAHDAAKELLEAQKNHNTKYVIYQSENIESVFFKNDYYIQLLRCNRVLNYSVYTATKMMEIYNIPTAGYFQWKYKKMYSHRTRDIDILFVGCLTQKRHDILREVQNTFPQLKLEVVVDVFGFELTELMLRSEYVLNISAYDNAVLETHRIAKALSCGCYVLSNLSADTKMNDKYRDYVYFCGKTLTDYIQIIKYRFNL